MKKLACLTVILAATIATSAEGHGDHFRAQERKEYRAELRSDRDFLGGRMRTPHVRVDEYGNNVRVDDGDSCDPGDVQEIDVSKKAAWNAVATIGVALLQRYLCERNMHSAAGVMQSADQSAERSQCIKPVPASDTSPIPNSDFEDFERWHAQNAQSDANRTIADPSLVSDISMTARERSMFAVAAVESSPESAPGFGPAEPVFPSGLMIGGLAGPTDGVWNIVVQQTADNGNRAVLVWCS